MDVEDKPDPYNTLVRVVNHEGGQCPDLLKCLGASRKIMSKLKMIRRMKMLFDGPDEMFIKGEILYETWPESGYLKPEHHDISESITGLSIHLLKSHPKYFEWLEPVPFSESPFVEGLKKLWGSSMGIRKRIEEKKEELRCVQAELEIYLELFPELRKTS